MQMNKDIAKELQGLIRLISFFKQIRHQETLEKLGFFFVNDLFNIIPFRQNILWLSNGKSVDLLSASGQVNIEKNGPLAQCVHGAVQRFLNKCELIKDAERREGFLQNDSYVYIHEFSDEERSEISQGGFEEFITPYMYHVIFINDCGTIGGLWLARDKALGEIERAILEDAGDALADKLLFYQKGRRQFLGFTKPRKMTLLLALAFLVFCLWPVRFSVTAAAEIVAEDLTVVTIPVNGLIEDIRVKPNAYVKKGDVLFSLEKTRIQNQYALRQQAFETAQRQLAKTEREVFSDPSKTPELNVLKEEVKLKRLELSYARDILDVSDAKASRDGVVLFSDKNDFLGKPVNAGDTVMTLADPKHIELLVRIPADAMIELKRDVPVQFFLNTEPLKSHKAYLTNISYLPTSDASGLLTYKARATIENIQDIEKIGLTGTAKVYGGRTFMILNLLRRPFIALRRLSGF